MQKKKKSKVAKVLKWLSIIIAIIGVVCLIVTFSLDWRHLEAMKACGDVAIACVIILPLIWIIYGIYSANTPEAKAERAKAEQEAAERLQREIELRVEQLETLKAMIDKTYIISTQERTVDAKYMAIGGFGQLNKTVENTTTFLIVLKDGTKKTDEVPDGSDMYNIYLQHIDTSNLNGGKA